MKKIFLIWGVLVLLVIPVCFGVSFNSAVWVDESTLKFYQDSERWPTVPQDDFYLETGKEEAKGYYNEHNRNIWDLFLQEFGISGQWGFYNSCADRGACNRGICSEGLSCDEPVCKTCEGTKTFFDSNNCQHWNVPKQEVSTKCCCYRENKLCGDELAGWSGCLAPGASWSVWGDCSVYTTTYTDCGGLSCGPVLEEMGFTHEAGTDCENTPSGSYNYDQYYKTQFNEGDLDDVLSHTSCWIQGEKARYSGNDFDISYKVYGTPVMSDSIKCLINYDKWKLNVVDEGHVADQIGPEATVWFDFSQGYNGLIPELIDYSISDNIPETNILEELQLFVLDFDYQLDSNINLKISNEEVISTVRIASRSRIYNLGNPVNVDNNPIYLIYNGNTDSFEGKIQLGFEDVRVEGKVWDYIQDLVEEYFPEAQVVPAPWQMGQTQYILGAWIDSVTIKTIQGEEYTYNINRYVYPLGLYETIKKGWTVFDVDLSEFFNVIRTCSSDSDCGQAEWLWFNVPYCQNGDVYGRYRIPSCENPGTEDSICASHYEDRIKESCVYGCEAGRCLLPPNVKNAASVSGAEVSVEGEKLNFNEEDEIIIEFVVGEDDLDLINVAIERNDGSLLVKGLDLGDGSKTVYVGRVGSGSKICVLDAEIDSLDEMTADCSGENEVLLDCPGSVGDYSCEIVDGRFKVSGLKHSGLREVLYCGDGSCNNGEGCSSCSSDCGSCSDENNGGGGSGGKRSVKKTTPVVQTPEPICTPNWQCGQWEGICDNSFRTRLCEDGCGREKIEKLECSIPEPEIVEETVKVEPTENMGVGKAIGLYNRIKGSWYVIGIIASVLVVLSLIGWRKKIF